MSRRGKIRLAVVSSAVALVVLVIFCLRWQAQWQLNAYRKKLIASGEKLTVEELAPRRNPQATNTAEFLRLVATIKPFWQYQPSGMHSIKPGVARVAWRQAQLVETENGNQPSSNVWPGLIEAMTKNEQTLDELRSLVETGGVEFIQEDYNANSYSASYLAQARQVVVDFTARALVALHQGDIKAAYRDLTGCLATSQLTAKGPLMINQLVHYACMSVSATACWEALQAGGWTDNQLAQLQYQWEQSDVLAAAWSSMAMERARGPMMFQAARASRQGLEDLLGEGTGIKNNSEIWQDFLLHVDAVPSDLLAAYPRYWGWRWIWSYRDEQRYVESMQTIIDSLRQAQQGHSILSLFKGQDESAGPNPLMARNFDMAGAMTVHNKRFVGQALHAQTIANLVTTAMALERYRLAHHAYPAALANLAPEFVQAVPVDCMDGHELRYRPNADGTYLLYSVGEDGVDNGGDATPAEGKNPSFFKGRDWVWPRPATAEEVEAYEAQQGKTARRK
jgi:hypothetical protein